MAKAPTKAAAPAAKTTAAPASAAKAGFAKKLGGMKKLWSQSNEASSGGGGPNFNIENGKHEARLVEVKLTEVSGGSKIMVRWVWDCLDVGSPEERASDPEIGITAANDGIDTEQNIGHLKRKLRFFGFDAGSIQPEELEQAFEMITNGHPICDIRVWRSTDDQWQNHALLGNQPTGWESDPWGGDAEEAAEEAAEEEAATEEGDELDGLDRQGLLKYIAANKASFTAEVKVFKTDADDAIREKIRAASPVAEEEAVEEEAVEEEAEEEVVEESPAIEAGAVVLYTPPRAKAALTCEVVDVDDKGTAKLKNTESGKLLAARVALDQLELASAEEAVEATEEEEFGTITKGSKVEVQISGKAYKGVVDVDPKPDAQTVKVKLSDGPFKGKVKDIPVEDIEPLE